jgi:hypothetical protein
MVAIQQVVDEIASEVAQQCISVEKALVSSVDDAVIGCFPGLASHKTSFTVTLRDVRGGLRVVDNNTCVLWFLQLAQRRAATSTGKDGVYHHSLPLMIGASAGGSALSIVESITVVAYQIASQQDIPAVLLHFPACDSSNNSETSAAYKIDQIKSHVNASTAWLTGFAKYLTTAVAQTAPTATDMSTLAIERLGMQELVRWQRLQWAVLPVSSQALRVSSSQYGDTLCTTVSRCATYLASGHLGGRVMIWELATSGCVEELDYRGDAASASVDVTSIGVKSLEFDATGVLLCVRYSDNSIRVWQRRPEQGTAHSGLISRLRHSDGVFHVVWKCVLSLPHTEKLSFCGFLGESTPLGTATSMIVATVTGSLAVYILSGWTLSPTSTLDRVAEYQRSVTANTGKSWQDHTISSVRSVVAPPEVRAIYCLRAMAWKRERLKMRRDQLRRNLRKIIATLPWIGAKSSISTTLSPQTSETGGVPRPNVKPLDLDPGDAVRRLTEAYARRMEIKSRVPLIHCAPPVGDFELPLTAVSQAAATNPFQTVRLFGHSHRIVYCGRCGECFSCCICQCRQA